MLERSSATEGVFVGLRAEHFEGRVEAFCTGAGRATVMNATRSRE